LQAGQDSAGANGFVWVASADGTWLKTRLTGTLITGRICERCSA
jgi:hypothetical protein